MSDDTAPRQTVPTHGHHHSGPLALAPGESRRVRGILAALIIPLLILTLVGLVWMWPGHVALIGSQPFAASESSLGTARITSTDIAACAQAADVLNGSDAGQPVVGDAKDTGASAKTDTLGSGGARTLLNDAVCAQITSGQGEGLTVPVHIPAESLPAATVGDDLRVMYTPQALAGGTPYVFVDYDRHLPVSILAVAYLVLVIAVAGLKGLRSVCGLILATGVLLRFMLPALLDNQPPLAVTLVGSMAMMLFAVYIAHGISVRTTTALLGTLAGVVITVVLSLWGVRAADLTGAVGDDALTLTTIAPHLNLQALLTCGMVIAGLGVLNDVTITQASAVWELHAANPTLGRGRLFTGGMRIGRDHIASTVYTLAFAYAGTALPLILSAALIDRAVLETLLSGEIAEEVVRTLVSSIGLVLAIPATTAIAALLCAPRRHLSARDI